MTNVFVKLLSIFITGLFLTFSVTSCDSNSTVNKGVGIESMVIDGVTEIPKSTTTQLNTVATISDGTNTLSDVVNDKVDWTTSNPDIAGVDKTGLVTSFAPGNVVITASAHINSEIITSHELKVIDATLMSIQIERGYNPDVSQVINSLDVEISNEEYITAWGIYSDGSRRYINTDTFWWSSDQQIASINSFNSSNVFGRDLGTVTISAFFWGMESSIAVNIIPETGRILQRIEIRDGWGNSNDVTGGLIDIEKDKRSPVVAYGHYSDGSREDINARVAWSSSNLGVAFILDELSSYVYGISVGTATITASWQGVDAFVIANVVASTYPVLQSIEIQKGYSENGNGEVIDLASPLTLPVGEVVYITAWGNYSNGTKEYINTDVFWLSDDNTIAGMPVLQTSSNITGVSSGATQVSARLDGIEGRAAVVVP